MHQVKTYAVIAILALTSSVASAATTSIAGPWIAATPHTSGVPTIPSPAQTQRDTFTAYPGYVYNYTVIPFTAAQNGIYSATVETAGFDHTSWFLEGTFAPGAPPTTLLTNFFAGIYSGGATPHISSFTNLNLQAGKQYTLLIAYNSTDPGMVSTYDAAINGPNCVNMAGSTCAGGVLSPTAIPTLGGGALLFMSSILALLGMAWVRRKQG